MNFIKVERIIARNGTVEASFQERSPLGIETPGAPQVILADSGHSGEDRLATVHVLHRPYTSQLVADFT